MTRDELIEAAEMEEAGSFSAGGPASRRTAAEAYLRSRSVGRGLNGPFDLIDVRSVVLLAALLILGLILIPLRINVAETIAASILTSLSLLVLFMLACTCRIGFDRTASRNRPE